MNIVACSIVSTRRDYCNALLLAGVSEKNLHKLQLVRNTLAHVVTGTRRRDHITPVLAELHWLPVRARITFKIATHVSKIKLTRQPSYLADLIMNYKPLRKLRSASRLLLPEPVFVAETARRFFRFSAARTWNGYQTLNQLGTFRNEFKTHLSRLSYCS